MSWDFFYRTSLEYSLGRWHNTAFIEHFEIPLRGPGVYDFRLLGMNINLGLLEVFIPEDYTISPDSLSGSL